MIVLLSGLALFLGYAGLLFFYKRGWKQLPDYAPPHKATASTRVSVIVAARNEAANINNLLTALQKQTYSSEAFEVIVVDDHSTDATPAIVKDAGGSVKLVNMEPGITSKKKAIAAGIRAASGTLIVTTDADCLPGPRWLQTLVQFYEETGAAFIAAPVKYSGRYSFLDLFQTLDFITLQGITAASVSTNFHTMCNGANLAYTRQAFEEVDGFAGIDSLASGDDMLLMYKIWKRHPQKVHYLKSREAIVHTAPAPGWGAFIWQRIRWGSKTAVYEDRRIFWALLLVFLFNLWFVLTTVAGFWESHYWIYVLALLAAKTLVEIPFVLSVARFFGQGRMVRFFPLFQPLHILYTVFIGLASQTGSYQWKGRKTK